MKSRTNKLEQIYKKKLKRELNKNSVYNLIELNQKGEINYTPDYQRNYIWRVAKATNLIETILINGEIPPITVISVQGEKEIIDGRQRYETLLRFYNNKFKLVENGLQNEILKELSGCRYKDLPINLRKIFDEYRFKIIEYTADTVISEEDIELVKRDLFLRNNYGLTALKKAEIARAMYLYETLTQKIEEIFIRDKDFYEKCKDVLLPDNKKDNDIIEERDKINLLLVNIREMIISQYMPIIKENSVTFGANTINKYYQCFIINGLTDKEKKEKKDEFVKIFNKLYLIKEKLKKDKNYLRDNILFFKATYWMLAILYKEYSNIFYNFNINQFCHYVEDSGKEYFDNYENWTATSIKSRYNYMKNYIEKELKLNIDEYMEEIKNEKRKRFVKRSKRPKNNEIWNKIGSEKQVATYMDSMKISEIIKLIKEERFIIRTNYQRGEVKSRKKASRIIESILLGVKLPPVYIYVNIGEDGLERYTVLDGQQRLIGILKFIGEQITDEKYKFIKTFKNKYALCGLKDFEDLNGKVYEEGENSISESKRSLIKDYVLDFIRINKEGNENFNPVDMFLRLNQNPCPIGNNSFEFWNAYDNITKEIKKIKKIASYRLFKQNSTKMQEAEMVTTFAYMNYNEIDFYDINKVLSVYKSIKNKNKRDERYEIKLKIMNKEKITNYLEKINPNSKDEEEFSKSIDSVNDFIDKLNILAKEGDEQFFKIFNPYMKKPRRITKNDFYIIWLLLQEIDVHIVKTYRNELIKDMEDIFKLMKNMPENKDEKYFISYVKNIGEKYSRHMVK